MLFMNSDHHDRDVNIAFSAHVCIPDQANQFNKPTYRFFLYNTTYFKSVDIAKGAPLPYFHPHQTLAVVSDKRSL
jgi:hypothetical protein